MRTPGIEPGSQAWEACMIPLHYVRMRGEAKKKIYGPTTLKSKQMVVKKLFDRRDCRPL